MLLAVLLLAHARADWVEITQLHKPENTRLTDSVEFHDDQRSRPTYTKEPSELGRRTKPQLSTEHDFYDERSKPQFSTVPNESNDHYDLKRFKLHFTTEAIELYNDDKRKRLPIQFSTEPGFLADYKRNRIYINHTVDHSTEKYWSKGVVHRVPNPTAGTVKRINLTTEEPAKVKYEETDLTHELNQGYTIRDPFKTFVDPTPEFVTKEETFEDDGDDERHFVRKPPEDVSANGNEIKPKYNPKNNSPMRRVDTEENESLRKKTPINVPKDEDHSDRTTESGAKVNTMENVLKLVKVVADTIAKNTRRGVTGKVRYLEDLKETIMMNIEDRIESLWPDDSGGAVARRRRWTRSAESRGHVEFPSSESALMTISFLTFAVYLIKLVLQVIQTYKNKTMMVTPAVFAAVGRSANGDRPAAPK